MTRKYFQALAAPTAIALTLALSGTVQAQPDAAPGMGGNPPNQQGGGGRGGRGGGNMTPEQRAQMMQQMKERRALGLRQMMTQANITDGGTQTFVIDYVDAQTDAEQSLQDKARAVQDALRNPNSTDEQIATALADFRAAVAAEKARREAALKQLDEDVSYSKNPRMDALLTMGGLIGDEASYVGGMGGRGGGPGGFGGMGGPGGRGGRGGQGGQGGQRGQRGQGGGQGGGG